MRKDPLYEFAATRTVKNPSFLRPVEEGEARRKIGRQLARKRAKHRLTQTVVAARMGTSASVVSKLEAGGDVRLSTLQRYYAAIGETLHLR